MLGRGTWAGGQAAWQGWPCLGLKISTWAGCRFRSGAIHRSWAQSHLNLCSVREQWKALPLIKATAPGAHTTSQLVRLQLGRAPLECSTPWEGKVPHPVGIQGKENATTHNVTYATQSSRAALQSSGRPPHQLSSLSCKKLVSLWPWSPAAYIGSKRKGRQGYHGRTFFLLAF